MTAEKEYMPVDLSQNTRYASFEEHLNATCTPEEIKEIKRRNARMSCAYALTTMRIKACISRKMMAEALRCSPRRILSIEMENNDRINMPTLLKYVEVTGLPFKAVLEDGRTIRVSTVPKRRKPSHDCDTVFRIAFNVSEVTPSR